MVAAAVVAACPDLLQRNCVVVICSNNGTSQMEDHMLSQNYDVTLSRLSR